MDTKNETPKNNFNSTIGNTVLSAVPIVSTHLEDKYGFECKVDYDKDFAADEYYSLKIATYKKKIVGNLEIHITDIFKFVEAPDTYKYQSTTVEIVQGTEFQEIKIDKMWQLLMLIDMLQGVQRHSNGQGFVSVAEIELPQFKPQMQPN